MPRIPTKSAARKNDNGSSATAAVPDIFGSSSPLDGRGDRTASSPPSPAKDSSSPKTGADDYTVPVNEPEFKNARELLKYIGDQFVRLRRNGRSPAWAALEDRFMKNAHILIDAGMMSPKDMVQIGIEIEGFRKTESGNSKPPGDVLAQWLQGIEV